jgi:hypothetical protein
VTHKSGGSAAAVEGWTLAGSNFDDRGQVGSVFFTCPDRPGIWLSLTLVLDGTETVTAFEIHQQHPGAAADASIGTRLLRSVPLGELAAAAMRELSHRADRGTSPQFWSNDSAGYEQAMLKSLALRSTPLGHKRPGRRGRPDRYYAELAMEYEAWRQTGSRLATLARRRHMSESALRAALNTARTKELLSKAPAGTAGGVATDKAKAIIRQGTPAADQLR